MNIFPKFYNLDVNRSERISAADLQSICQEAGMQAVRKNRYFRIIEYLNNH